MGISGSPTVAVVKMRSHYSRRNKSRVVCECSSATRLFIAKEGRERKNMAGLIRAVEYRNLHTKIKYLQFLGAELAGADGTGVARAGGILSPPSSVSQPSAGG